MSGQPNPEGVKFKGVVTSIAAVNDVYHVTVADEGYTATLDGPNLDYLTVGASINVSFHSSDGDGGSGGD